MVLLIRASALGDSHPKLHPVSSRARCQIVFVTGTDTGVGKTVFTCQALRHLRARGKRALALKPFCSGGRTDAERLCVIQGQELPLDVVNPWHFTAPVAPPAAAGSAKDLPRLDRVVRHILKVAEQCELLLVEGAGGLLVPLGVDYTVADLVRALPCSHVVVVGLNRLGTINHTLLTLSHLERVMSRRRRPCAIPVVWMETARPDRSASSNARLIRGFASDIALYRWPFLGRDAEQVAPATPLRKKIEKTLAEIFSMDSV